VTIANSGLTAIAPVTGDYGKFTTVKLGSITIPALAPSP